MNSYTPAPQFRVDGSAPADVEFALHELEQSINTDPYLLDEALTMAIALRLPANSTASLLEIAEQTKVTSPLWDLNAVIKMWQEYEENQTWKYLDFDDDSNEEIRQNHLIKTLVEQLHNNNAKSHDATRQQIRTTRMSLFIGRIITFESNHESK